MGIFDRFKSKANELKDKAGDVTDKAKGGDQAGDTTGQPGDMAGQARDRAAGLADRAGDKAKDATGGRFGDQIDRGVDIAKQRTGDTDQAARADADQQQQP